MSRMPPIRDQFQISEEKQRAKDERNIFTDFFQAVELNQVGPAVARLTARSGPVDEDFRISDGQWDLLMGEFDMDEIEDIAMARSESDFDIRVKQARDLREARRKLANWGVGGNVVFGLASGVSDLAFSLPGLGAAGLVAKAGVKGLPGLSASASMMTDEALAGAMSVKRAALLEGAAIGGIEAAGEALITLTDTDRTGLDVAMAGLIGGTLGGAGGALGQASRRADSKEYMDAVWRQRDWIKEQHRIDNGFTPYGNPVDMDIDQMIRTAGMDALEDFNNREIVDLVESTARSRAANQTWTRDRALIRKEKLDELEKGVRDGSITTQGRSKEDVLDRIEKERTRIERDLRQPDRRIDRDLTIEKDDLSIDNNIPRKGIESDVLRPQGGGPKNFRAPGFRIGDKRVGGKNLSIGDKALSADPPKPRKRITPELVGKVRNAMFTPTPRQVTRAEANTADPTDLGVSGTIFDLKRSVADVHARLVAEGEDITMREVRDIYRQVRDQLPRIRERQNVVDNMMTQPEVSLDEIDPIRKTTMEPGDFMGEENAFPDEASNTAVRRSMASMVGGAEMPPEVRTVANIGLDDALAKKGGRANRRSMLTAVHTKLQASVSRMGNGFGRGYRLHQKESGRGGMRTVFSNKDRMLFAVGITRKKLLGQQLTKAEEMAFQPFSAEITRALEFGKRHRILDLEGIEADPDFVPVMWHAPKWLQLQRMIGNEALVSNVRRAVEDSEWAQELQQLFPGKADKIIDNFATVFVRSQIDRGTMDKGAKLALDQGTDLRRIRKLLNDPAIRDKLSEDDIEDMVTAIENARRAVKEKSRVGTANRRTPMNYATKLLDDNGDVIRDVEGNEMDMTHLMNLDIRHLGENYVRTMYGNSAAMSLVRGYNYVHRKPGQYFTHINEVVEDAKDKLKARYSGKGAGMTKRQFDNANEILDSIPKLILGEPLEASDMLDTFLRRMRALNYVLLSGSFGIATLPEFGNVAANNGVRSMLQEIPEAVKIMRQARSGAKMDNDLLAFLQEHNAPGDLFHLHRRNAWGDELDFHAGAGKLGMFDSAMELGGKASGILGGFLPINMILNTGAQVSVATKLLRTATRGGKISKKRLAEAGLTEQEWADMSAWANRLKENGHLVIGKGALGADQVKKFRPELDEDIAMLNRFNEVTQKWAQQIAIVTEEGNVHPFFNRSVGRTLLQFRRFSFGAHEKGLLNRVRMRDEEAAISMLYSSMIGALTYTAQMEIIARALPEREKERFREERMGVENGIIGGVGRAGWLGIGASVTDGLFQMMGGDALFYRTSGLSSSIFSLDQNPTVANINRAYQFISGVNGAAIFGDEVDENTYMNGMRLLPFHRVPYINAAARMAATSMAESSDE